MTEPFDQGVLVPALTHTTVHQLVDAAERRPVCRVSGVRRRRGAAAGTGAGREHLVSGRVTGLEKLLALPWQRSACALAVLLAAGAAHLHAASCGCTASCILGVPVACTTTRTPHFKSPAVQPPLHVIKLMYTCTCTLHQVWCRGPGRLCNRRRRRGPRPSAAAGLGGALWRRSGSSGPAGCGLGGAAAGHRGGARRRGARASEQRRQQVRSLWACGSAALQ